MNSLSIFLGAIGPMQVIVVIALIVLLFGGKKIPELKNYLNTKLFGLNLNRPTF